MGEVEVGEAAMGEVAVGMEAEEPGEREERKCRVVGMGQRGD